MIDTHHHFWRYNPVDFDWIGDEMACLRRHFGPEELEPVLRRHGVDRVISVQARQSVEETSDLLEYKRQYSRIAGVIGWLPLRSENLARWLESFSTHQKALVGLRHVVQGEPPGFLDDTALNQGIQQLTSRGLVFDLLVFAHQLSETIRFVDRHPGQIFVLDHLGKPPIRSGAIEPWKSDIRELAARQNVFCKISGGITELDLNWEPDRLKPYLDEALEAFGADRLMFGSNWPVIESAGGYDRWLSFVRDWAARLSMTEQDSLFASCAERVYLKRPAESKSDLDIG